MLLIAGLAGLAGCAPQAARLALPASPQALASDRSFSGLAGVWPQQGWWRDYGDPQLDALIAAALAGSPDVKAAAARLREAQALAQQADAALEPSVSTSASAGLQKQSYNLGIPRAFVPRGWNDVGRATIDGSLDLDLWGRNRAALAAATSEARAAATDAAQAELMLTTAVASAYADLAQLYASRDVTDRALALRTSTSRINRDRVANGLDNRGVQELSDARLAQARAELLAADEAIALTRNRLAALVGAGPDRGLAITRPRIAALAARGLPPRLALDLLGRRPDILAARLRTEASAGRIRSARAAFYPNIDLTALIGLQSLGLDQLTRSGSTIGSVGPAISLPLFGRGRLTGELRGTEARYDEAVAQYDATLVTALREVADAASSIRTLQDRRSETAAALAAAEAAYAIARQRYDGGLATYLDVLTAEDTVLERRRAGSDLAARAFTLDVALIRALGGGFVPPSAAALEGPDHG